MADDCGFVAFHTRSPCSPTLAGTSPGSSPVTVAVDPEELVRLRAIAQVAEGLATALEPMTADYTAGWENQTKEKIARYKAARSALAAYREAKG
jgi:hypothetical protein